MMSDYFPQHTIEGASARGFIYHNLNDIYSPCPIYPLGQYNTYIDLMRPCPQDPRIMLSSSLCELSAHLSKNQGQWQCAHSFQSCPIL